MNNNVKPTVNRLKTNNECWGGGTAYFYQPTVTTLGHHRSTGAPMMVSDCGQLCWSVITVYLPVHLVCYNRGLHQHYTLRQSYGWPCDQVVLNNSATRGGLNSYERRPAGLQDTLVTTLHFPLPLSPEERSELSWCSLPLKPGDWRKIEGVLMLWQRSLGICHPRDVMWESCISGHRKNVYDVSLHVSLLRRDAFKSLVSFTFTSEYIPMWRFNPAPAKH